MKNTSSSASNSAVATSTLKVNDDAFSIKLIDDKATPGQFVGKDWDGKVCLFERGFQAPTSWKADWFVLVTLEGRQDEKFRRVRPVTYGLEDDTEWSWAAAKRFSGVLLEAFESDSHTHVCDWLDAQYKAVLVSPELEAAIAAEGRDLQFQKITVGLSHAGEAWLRQALRQDTTWRNADDHRAVVKGEKEEARLGLEFRNLLTEDKDRLVAALMAVDHPLHGAWADYHPRATF